MQKVLKKYSLNIQGIVFVHEDGRITVSVADKGEFDLGALMMDFNNNECKLSVSYDEDYDTEVDEATGDIVE